MYEQYISTLLRAKHTQKQKEPFKFDGMQMDGLVFYNLAVSDFIRVSTEVIKYTRFQKSQIAIIYV